MKKLFFVCVCFIFVFNPFNPIQSQPKFESYTAKIGGVEYNLDWGDTLKVKMILQVPIFNFWVGRIDSLQFSCVAGEYDSTGVVNYNWENNELFLEYTRNIRGYSFRTTSIQLAPEEPFKTIKEYFVEIKKANWKDGTYYVKFDNGDSYSFVKRDNVFLFGYPIAREKKYDIEVIEKDGDYVFYKRWYFPHNLQRRKETLKIIFIQYIKFD